MSTAGNTDLRLLFCYSYRFSFLKETQLIQWLAKWIASIIIVMATTSSNRTAKSKVIAWRNSDAPHKSKDSLRYMRDQSLCETHLQLFLWKLRSNSSLIHISSTIHRNKVTPHYFQPAKPPTTIKFSGNTNWTNIEIRLKGPTHQDLKGILRTF